MHLFQTYLESFHNVTFCSKLTRELLFFIFAGSCCHDCGLVYAIISSKQYTTFGNRLSRYLGFLMVYGIFLSLDISFIIGGQSFQIFENLNHQLLIGILLSPVCSNVCNSSTINHFYIIVTSPEQFDFSVRPNGSKHLNKWTITELYTDESV